jgi:hypothetical protein
VNHLQEISFLSTILSSPSLATTSNFGEEQFDCERQVVHNCKKSKIVHELNSFALEDASSWFADRQRTWELK